MDHSEISKKIKSGEYTLSKFDGKSQCWKLFSKILDTDGSEIFGLVCCSKCQSCIVYKKRDPAGKVTDFGTKNLLGHMKHCNPAATGNTSGTVKSYFQSCVKVDKRTADSIKVAESKLVSGCHLSFNIVDNANLKSFAQTMIEVGAKYGNIAADSVLYGRKTIREKHCRWSLMYKPKLCLACTKQLRTVLFPWSPTCGVIMLFRIVILR